MNRTTKTVDEVAGVLQKPGRKANKVKKPSSKSVKPKTDVEARSLAIKNGWGPMLKRFPEMGKA